MVFTRPGWSGATPPLPPSRHRYPSTTHPPSPSHPTLVLVLTLSRNLAITASLKQGYNPSYMVTDLTADVDFSELAAQGERHGLRTVYFGPQATLTTLSLTTDLNPNSQRSSSRARP